MADFTVGDQVQLKSGGPVMTVTEIEGDKASCQWFDNNEPKQMRFVTAALDKFKGSDFP